MSEEQAAATKTTKPKTEVEVVKMEDGREVPFAGKRRINKEYLIDEGKIQKDESGAVLFAPGAVSVRFDLRNGATRTFGLPTALLAQFAGHGAAQKYGDELAAPADKPLSEEDMVLALEGLDEQIQGGSWRAEREGGGGFSGASIVILAIIEELAGRGIVKSVDEIKAFLAGKVEQHKNDTTPLTRQKLYASFRANPKIAPIITRLEQEKAAKAGGATAIDADAALAELG